MNSRTCIPIFPKNAAQINVFGAKETACDLTKCKTLCMPSPPNLF